MIRPLRQRHRLMVFAATAVVPLAFAWGLATRKEVPASSAAEPARPAATEVQSELWRKHTLQTRLLRMGSGAGQVAIELVSPSQIIRPDVLVYWVPGTGNLDERPPQDAFLLGSFESANPRPLLLPGAALAKTGRLVLYSLADQAMVATSAAFAAE